MFGLFKRKPSASPAGSLVATADRELDGLRAEIARRQGKAAELEADLTDSRESLAAFQHEFEARLRPHLNRIAQLREEVKAAQRAAFRRLWEDGSYAPRYVDVEEQFRTAWSETDSGAPPPPPPPVTADIEQQIKALYRELAKKYHPDLAATEDERAWRTPRMAAVNAAYAARNLVALQALAANPDAPLPESAPATREAQIAALRREIDRLDALIERLEREFDELTNSPALQMQLDASMAKRAGRDLIGEAAAELLREIRGLESELNVLKP